MIWHSFLERNHQNLADLALSVAASAVWSTARLIVHFAWSSSLCRFHPWINEGTYMNPIKAESSEANRRRRNEEVLGGAWGRNI